MRKSADLSNPENLFDIYDKTLPKAMCYFFGFFGIFVQGAQLCLGSFESEEYAQQKNWSKK